MHSSAIASISKVKHVFAVLSIGLFANFASADTTTNRLGLTVPTVGSSNWAPKINQNFQIIDATIAALGQSNLFTSSNSFAGYTQFTSTINFQAPWVATNECIGINNLGNATSFVCSGGSGGSGGSIIASPQFQLPYYSVAGTTTTVSGATGITTDGVGALTISTLTTTSAQMGSPSSVNGPNGGSAFHGSYLTVAASGTTGGILVEENGQPGGGGQTQQGGITIRNDANPATFPSTLLVLVDSTTDAQLGTALLDIYQLNPLHNDPTIWIHKTAINSGPEIRDDSGAPNWEFNSTSSDTTHGRGKWETDAVPFQSEILQVNSRAWDGLTYENVAYWEPLDIQSSIGYPGLYIRAQDLTDDSGVIQSSQTAGLQFFTLNGHTVGLQGPANASASWDFQLPSTFANAGQVLYQTTSSKPWNWAFTTGGTPGQVLTSQGISAPTWTTVSGGGGSSSAVSLSTGILTPAIMTSSLTVNSNLAANTVAINGATGLLENINGGIGLGNPGADIYLSPSNGGRTVIVQGSTLAFVSSNGYIGLISSASVNSSPLLFTLPNVLGTSGQSLTTDGNGNMIWANAVGGGASFLAVSNGATQISSPTAIINFASPTFGVSLTGSATAQVVLNQLPFAVSLTTGVIVPASNTNLLFNNGGGVGGTSSLSWNGSSVTINGGITTSSSTVKFATNLNGLVTISTNTVIGGHIISTGTAPSPSSCGGTPVLIGTDSAFTVTPGAAATGCTVTFATPYLQNPTCIVKEETESLTNALTFSHSATQVIITQSGAGSNVYDVICIGNKG